MRRADAGQPGPLREGAQVLHPAERAGAPGGGRGALLAVRPAQLQAGAAGDLPGLGELVHEGPLPPEIRGEVKKTKKNTNLSLPALYSESLLNCFAVCQVQQRFGSFKPPCFSPQAPEGRGHQRGVQGYPGGLQLRVIFATGLYLMCSFSLFFGKNDSIGNV